MSLFGGITLPGHPDLENVRKLDLLPIPMIRRMSRLGIAINPPYFADLTSQLEGEMKELRDEISCEIPADNLDMFCAMADKEEAERGDDWNPINVESGAQLAKLLFDVLGVGRGKDLKKTAGGDRLSTGKKQLEVLKKEHPIIDLVLRYRERSKLKSTYTSKLPRIAKFHPKGKCCPICELPHVESTHRVHTEFTSTRTDTGRLASKSPNLQNIPARTKLGRAVRAGFVSSPGTRLVSWDFSQIELRLLAHCAIEQNLIEIFERREDPHSKTAMRAFGKTLAEVEDGMGKMLYRAPCKNVNFGIVYGLAAPGLYDLMAVTYATAGLDLPDWLTVDWCEKFIKDWFGLYPDVEGYMEQMFYRARRYGVVWDIFGRIRRVPEVSSVLKWIKGAGLRQAGNMPIQASGAGLMKLAMGEVEEELTGYYENGIWVWPLLSIHDELVTEVDEDYADAVGEIKREVMDNVLVDKQSGRNLCRVPVLSDGHSMERWEK